MKLKSTRFIHTLSLVMLTGCLSACAGFFDKDNTPTPSPLVTFSPEATPHLVFKTKTGSGSNDEYLKLTPTISGNGIYTTSLNGYVAAVNKTNGQVYWMIDTKLPLSAGAGVGEGIVVVGGRRGDIVALNQQDGHEVWRTSIKGEILSAPAISHHHVIVKATDGSVHALDADTGHHSWTFIQTEPNLILRGSSNPRVHEGYAFVGFANGNLAKVGIRNGQAYWSRAIATAEGAFAIQRMIDIDADPVIYGHRVFAATYQGRIASVQWDSGALLWSRDISSYTGMAASAETVFISDAKSHLWALGANSGLVNWRQTELEARNISAPASMGNTVVVGDAQGYIHWLNKNDGHFVARDFAGAAIYAAPLVDNGIVYVYTNNGHLLAYTLS